MTMAMHLANEPALLSAARHGNSEAFSVLVRHYQKNIYRLAFKITQNHEDAEDSLQEALLKAYCNLDSFQGDSRFYTWLVRITMNEALMKLRKRRSDRQLSLDEVVAPGVENPAPHDFEDKRANPETQYAEVELQETLCGGSGKRQPSTERCLRAAQRRRLLCEGNRREVGPFCGCGEVPTRA